DDLPPYPLSFRPAETEAEAFADRVFAVPEALCSRFVDYRHGYRSGCVVRSEKPASQQMYAEGAQIIRADEMRPGKRRRVIGLGSWPAFNHEVIAVSMRRQRQSVARCGGFDARRRHQALNYLAEECDVGWNGSHRHAICAQPRIDHHQARKAIDQQ